MSKKIIYIAHTHNSRKTIWGGTIDQLTNNVFGYTLECGNSWNNKIPRYPKTAKSLVNALNNSAYECNKYYDSYDQSNENEFNTSENKFMA